MYSDFSFYMALVISSVDEEKQVFILSILSYMYNNRDVWALLAINIKHDYLIFVIQRLEEV